MTNSKICFNFSNTYKILTRQKDTPYSIKINSHYNIIKTKKSNSILMIKLTDYIGLKLCLVYIDYRIEIPNSKS